MHAMKEAKKSALTALIKSMNGKRMAKKSDKVEEDLGLHHSADEGDDPFDHDGDGQEDQKEMMSGSPDDDQEPGFEDIVKGFMKHGSGKGPMPSHKGPSMTVVMSGGFKKKK